MGSKGPLPLGGVQGQRPWPCFPSYPCGLRAPRAGCCGFGNWFRHGRQAPGGCFAAWFGIGGASVGGAGRGEVAGGRRHRLRCCGGDCGGAECRRAVHVGAGRHGHGHLLHRRREAGAHARFRHKGAVEVSRRPVQPPRGGASWPAVLRHAGQPGRMVRAGACAWPQETGRGVCPGGGAGARRACGDRFPGGENAGGRAGAGGVSLLRRLARHLSGPWHRRAGPGPGDAPARPRAHAGNARRRRAGAFLWRRARPAGGGACAVARAAA